MRTRIKKRLERRNIGVSLGENEIGVNRGREAIVEALNSELSRIDVDYGDDIQITIAKKGNVADITIDYLVLVEGDLEDAENLNETVVFELER